MTPRWHKWRRQGVGSSDAPVIMGTSPHITIVELWEEKTGRRQSPEQNFAMRRGVRLEPIARRAYLKESDVWLRPQPVIHPTLDFLRANLDGYNAAAKLVLEIKCPRQEGHKAAMAGRIPRKYIWQLVHQLMVTDAEVALYYGFNGESGVTVRFQRDRVMEGQLLEGEQAFWKCVVTDTPPVVSQKSSFRAIEKINSSGVSRVRRV